MSLSSNVPTFKPSQMKRCSKGDDCVHPMGCWQPATREYFYAESRVQDGLRAKCKTCCNQYSQRSEKRVSFVVKRALQSGYAVDIKRGVVYGKTGKLLSITSTRGYARVNLYIPELGRSLSIPLHKLIAYVAYGDTAIRHGYEVHHLNFNRLDNRASNLSIVTVEEHREIHKSGRKGISGRPRVLPEKAVKWDERENKWRFSVTRYFHQRDVAIEVYRQIIQIINGFEDSRTASPVYVCKCCNQIADQLRQPALYPGGAASVQVTCWTPGCTSWGLTKDTRDTADIDHLFTVQMART